MRTRPLLAALLLVALAPACGERPEPTGALAPAYPLTVRGAGPEAAVVGERPARIVALDAGSAELVAALGAAERLTAVPLTYVGERADGAVVAVGANGQVDLAAATDAPADLVVAAASGDPSPAETVAAETGAALYLQPAGSLTDVERAALELGLLVGAPVEGRRLAARIRTDAADVRRRLEGRPRVPVFVDTGFLVTIAPGSLAADLVDEARGRNVAADAAGAGAYGLCDVVRLEPEVFLRLTERGDGGLPPPRFDRCGARGDRIRYVELRAELVSRAGPGVAAGLEELAQVLHPDAFEG